MSNILLLNKDEKEKNLLKKQLRDAVAFYSNDYLKLIECQSVGDAKNKLKYDKQLDLALLEVLGNSELDFSMGLREEYDVLHLMLIANASISPMSYLNPRILPNSLLLRPFNQQLSNQTVREFVAHYYRNNEEKQENSIVIENKDGKTIIPYSNIYYIEVREKKLYIRVQNKEYTMYGTLSNIMQELPENFIRCHKSFVFNKTFLVNVKLSENTIYLEHDIAVPLSRSYKSDIKEIVNGKK